MHRMKRGILPLVALMATAALSGCSAGAELGQPRPSSSRTIPSVDMDRIRTCVDEVVRPQGQVASVTAYPTTADDLRNGAFALLPVSESVSGDVYLVWATGSFTDPYGMESAGNSSMWMVMPAGSPTDPCPTDDVGFGADPRVDPAALGSGVQVG
jgi:hypothetical protein